MTHESDDVPEATTLSSVGKPWELDRTTHGRISTRQRRQLREAQAAIRRGESISVEEMLQELDRDD